jgi:hypothetical protein
MTDFQMKRCLICNEFKVLTDFHVATDKPDGRRNDCKLCRKNKIKRNFNPLDKFCNHCKLFKPNNEKHFFKSSHKKTKSKFRAECKDCHRTRMKNYTLEERYGLSIEKYNELVLNQNFLCAICQEKPKRLVVDHNHHTGKTRELLCDGCNQGLGLFREQPEILTNAILYLRKHNDNKTCDGQTT